jgi:hypothetical protein
VIERIVVNILRNRVSTVLTLVHGEADIFEKALAWGYFARNAM